MKRRIMEYLVKKFRLGQYVVLVEDFDRNSVNLEWGWR